MLKAFFTSRKFEQKNIFLFCMKCLLVIGLIVLATQVFADSNSNGPTDLLKDTDADFWKTLNGTGKKYIYGAEFILAIASYIKSKNLLVFVGVIVIAVFFNIMVNFLK